MKKATILTLLIVVIAALHAIAQYAPISNIATVNSNLTTAIVPVRAVNFSNITDCNLKIVYNPAIIQATGVTAGPSLPGTVYAITTTPGIIEITWFTWPPVFLAGNSVIFNLAFTKVASGTSAISFEDDGYSCLWGDGNYNELIDVPSSTYYIGGSLSFGLAPVTMAPIIPICSGSTISVPVKVNKFDNIGQIFGLKLLYNSSVLTYQSFTNNSGFPGLTVNGTTPGVITIPPSDQSSSSSGISYPDSTVIFTLNFLYLGGSTALSWSDNGVSCMYRGPSPSFPLLVDAPTAAFYQDGLVEPLIAPTIIRNPDVASVCANTPVSATFTAGSGGINPVDHYESSIDAGNTWQTYVPGSTISETATGLAQIRIRTWRTSAGSACTHSGFVSTSWDVEQGSVGGTLNGSAAVCTGINSTILTLTGSYGEILKWQSSPEGTSWTDIEHTLPSYTATNLISTLHYRAVVKTGTCDPAYSSVATVTVNPYVPVSVSVAADANPSCSGIPVTFTATPVHGGSTPAFQWKVNGTDVPGASNATWSYSPVHGDNVTCTLVSSEMCVTGNPALSNQLTMTVNPVPAVLSALLKFALTPAGPWSPVSGELSSGYDMCIDPAVEFYYLDLSSLTSSQPLLSGNLNPFTIDTTNLPPTWLAYWSGRGVVSSSGNQYAWQDQMWQIIHGLAPVFYINYTIPEGHKLIDGLTYQLGGGLTPLRLSGDYPQWNYSYSGTVTGENSCISSFFDVFLELNTIPVVTDAVLQASTSSAGPWTPMNGDLPGGYNVCIDPSIEFYYLDINTLAASQPLLSNNLNPFVIDTNNLPPDWLAYWSGKGVNGPSGNQYPWQDQMWQIVNGFEPVFYINYTDGGDFQLIDGLNYQMGGGETAMRVYGDYPQWNYTYTGSVTDVNYCPSSFFDIFIEFNSIPNVNPVTDQTYCDGMFAPEVNLTGIVDGTSFSWENNHPEIGLPASGIGSIPAFYAINNGTVPIIATITVTPSTGSCSGEAVHLYNVNVSPNMPVEVTIASNMEEICAGATVTFNATVTFGGSAPLYKWFVNYGEVSGATDATYAYVPANWDIVTCEVTSSDGCALNNPATSNELLITVNETNPVSVAIVADDQEVCSGTLVTFTATPVNGGTTPAYQWFVNAEEVPGATNATFAYFPQNSDAVTCRLTSTVVCATGNPAMSNVLTISVTETKPVSVSIVADDPDVCVGSLVTFTATAVNGGTAPAYRWFVDAMEVSGATDATYAYVPAHMDVVTSEVTSNETICVTGNPATSNPVIVTVSELKPVSVSIVADATEVCDGTTVTFTATAINGGTAPGYTWFVNAIEISGATEATYSYVPVNSDVIACRVTSGEPCATGNPALSNEITVTVNELKPVSVTIAADNQEVCSGTLVTFTASTINGGTTPGYKWFVNSAEVAGATDAVYAFVPVDQDIVACQVASDVVCATGNPATSNAISMTVHPLLPVSVTLLPDANPVYEGTIVTLTATPLNGGINPTYKWMVNSVEVPGATGAAYTYVPANNDAIVCVVTSDVPCASGNPATSNTVIMIVDPNLPVSVTIAANENPVCSGSPVSFTAFPVNGGESPTYQWVVNNVTISGATDVTYTYTPSNSDAVYCILTSSLEHASGNPATSNTINITVTPQLVVMNLVAAGANPVCEGTPVSFMAIPVNGGSSPIFQWKVNSIDIPGATNAAYEFIPVHGDAVTCLLTSSELCTMENPVLSNTVTMMVNPLQPVSVTIAADANPVCESTTVSFTATPVNGGSSPAFQWQVNAVDVPGATGSGYSFVPANNDVVTCVLTSDIVCGTGSPATSGPISMTVNQNLPVSVTITADAGTVCSGTTVNFIATPVNGGTMPAYQWNVNGSPVTGATNTTFAYAPVHGDAVTCVLTSNASCISGNPATSNTVTMTVNNAPVPTVMGQNSVCVGAPALFYMTEGGMSNYQWTISSGGTITGNFGNVIFVAWHTAGDQWLRINYTNSSGCSAVTPTQYNVTVNPLPVPTISGAVSVCTGSTGVVYTTEAGMTNYTWSFSPGGVNTSGGTSTSNTMTMTWNTAGAQWVRVSYTSAAGCAAAAPTTLNVTVTDPVPASVTIVASQNPVNGGTPVTFTASPVNGGSTPTFQWNVNGSDIAGATSSTYTYVPLNNDAVVCVMTSSLTCVTGSPATSNTVVMVVNGVPENRTVQNITVASGQTECYDALQTITVAGSGTTFDVQSGGSATFIAGQSVVFLPGTTVQSGGYMLAQIAPSGPFCGGALPPVVPVIAGGDEAPVQFNQALFTIYPNPTTGNFTLVQKGSSMVSSLRVEILTMTGEKVLATSMVGEKKREFSLSDMPAGLYFVKVIADDAIETIKVIKTR